MSGQYVANWAGGGHVLCCANQLEDSRKGKSDLTALYGMLTAPRDFAPTTLDVTIANRDQKRYQFPILVQHGFIMHSVVPAQPLIYWWNHSSERP